MAPKKARAILAKRIRSGKISIKQRMKKVQKGVCKDIK